MAIEGGGTMQLSDITAITKVRKGSGNGEFFLTIPAEVAKELQLTLSDKIFWIKRDGYLLIKKGSPQAKETSIT